MIEKIKLFVTNLNFQSTAKEIEILFEQHGKVFGVDLPRDKRTGRPKGFAFVEMFSEDAEKALKHLSGELFGGRELKIEEAKKKQNA
jgi:RNA recognition motif-containing protein